MNVMTESDGSNGTTKKVAYALVGFSLLLTLRVGMNGAIFCMKRFRIPEHLFSLYVSRVHNAIELGGFVGNTFGTIYSASEGFGTQECENVSIANNWLFFLINVVLFSVYVTGGEEGHLTDFYWALAFSAFVYGMNIPFSFKLGGDDIVYFLATIQVSGIFTSVYQFIFLKLFGNKRRYDTDFLIIAWELFLSIIITGATAAVWTVVYYNGTNNSNKCGEKNKDKNEGNDHSNGGGSSNQTSDSISGHAISAMVMCVFAQGVVYVFYPAIAPGMLVDFRNVTKIDQALLIIAPIPYITIAILDVNEETKKYSPKNKWEDEKAYWHGTLIFIPVMGLCGILFIKALHYPYSGASLAIVNKPGMVGFLTILFYVSHMILLAVGYAGVGPNWNSTGSTVNGFLTNLSMILLIFLAEGYINEFKKHYRAYWPTTGLSNKRAFGFWFDKALQNGFKNIMMIFTRDLRRDLLSALD
ncbi:Tpr family protein [Theileria parva strain Muguga]|uniref:Uncharacterized protein n=1 Tax=Theileria parva TaxID=5875 RepID=Q4N880_THEPA|nr:uncharacterized protein TpMuguga_01g00590 [Theileria parva strain Muguga]EAN33828.1 Tpr family protein [Theileria parva strain Muguga]|eukprot:XP_766111.1 hypothetical protein [Theileria parva strain Muguga]